MGLFSGWRGRSERTPFDIAILKNPTPSRDLPLCNMQLLALAKIESYRHVPMVYRVYRCVNGCSARCSAQVLPNCSAKGIGVSDHLQLCHQQPTQPTGFVLFPQITGAIWSNTAEVQHSCQPFETRDWNPLLTGVVYKSFHLELEFVQLASTGVKPEVSLGRYGLCGLSMSPFAPKIGATPIEDLQIFAFQCEI